MSHHTRFIRSIVSLAAVLSLSLALPAQASRTQCEDGVTTRPVTFSVVLPDNNTYQIAGYFYWRGQLEGKVLQVALHGGSYNHKYWDANEIDGHQYSYARYMACRGYAVLAIDNLGVGESSKPDGDFVTAPVQAVALHQIVGALRAGEVGTSFRKIVLVGHSMGSLQAIFEQGTFNDADGLVVTGWENTPHPVNLPMEVFGPLMANPYFAVPGWMRTIMFYAGEFDPGMPGYDNQDLVGEVPRGLFTYAIGSLLGLAPTHSEGVRGPVLVVCDEHDLLMPVSLAAGEATTYPSASSVTTHVVYGTGHDLNLHLTNLDEWARITSWIRENVGGGAEDGAN